ncbi:sensor histidine kinase [Pedobacter xixiisoli]|uniref:Histidine kinase-, DNA gyrase B-, and HSP90-like ATPase n=1 Tax=Pedobacter xixiisoli TaxID=1476464 RepID=A0A285ZUJ2_9SPHI|nr:histidine kinase [Pedobacter xixiisoli]SOD13324.1 Histidine kinase-, DNA gyrase B-, and HSP90-like ATPase [Pedobacter xixiisoli]
MKNSYALLCLVIFCTAFYGCEQKAIDKKLEDRQKALQGFKDASEELKQSSDAAAKLKYWNRQLANPQFNTDSVLVSKIHYNIAGVFYSMSELDSIKNHMQVAWELMENQTGYDADKVQLFSGLGNIANLEQKVHQENYYYNSAAQMLLADSAINLTPKQKITIYFSAAQSSAKLRQFKNAFVLNRKAMELLPLLKDNQKEKFRAYSQIAVCYFKSGGSTDSLYSYIKKMEQLYMENPNKQSENFLYDRKATYFSKVNIADSAFYYSQKRLKLDLEDELQNGARAFSVTTGNLYTSYCDMAGVFIESKQLDSAAYYLKQCENFAKKYPDKIDDESLLLYEQNLVNYSFATKKYADAERQQDILLRRTRFLYELESSRAIAEMSTIFQLQAKDKSILNLNETVVLAQSNLQKNRLWLLVSTLAFLLAVAIISLLYFIQRQRKLKNEAERAQLEQRLLRTQMEPHFIFNTLSALQSFIRFNDNEKALKYLHQFGRLLRSSLESSREGYVKLSEEIDTLENYLSLQQMRYDDAFCYQINYDEEQDVESICIPPMLMQPFVENAILHGINPNGKNGLITVNLNVKEKTVLVTITDNGKGISQEVKPQQHKSLSTTISKERLAIIAKESGVAAGIEIKSEKNKGTVVTLTIPIKMA